VIHDLSYLHNSELENLIDERLRGRNAARNRKIVKRKLLDGLTYEQVAEEFELSVRQVKYIVYKCRDKIL
jgi:DNA-directed RNA polymerase specialized sigma24 family protein